MLGELALGSLGCRRYAGDPGFAPVHPQPGVELWTTSPESGCLERVRIIRRRPDSDFDQYAAWEWEWLSGPDAGTRDVRYGRGFYAETAHAR